MKKKFSFFLLFSLLFLFILSVFSANAAPLFASALPEGRMLDEGHDTGYIDWNGSVYYETIYHRDGTCNSGCWEPVTRVNSGSSISGSFQRDVTYFETMAAFEYGAGVVTLSACGATAQWYIGISNPNSDPGFNSFPLSVPVGCRNWTVSASSGFIHIRSLDVHYVAAQPTNTPTATSTATATATGTSTSTPTSTHTATTTFTPSETPTGTLTPSSTATNTATASNTPTQTNTFTPSPTFTPSSTFLPGTPSFTPRPPTKTLLPPPAPTNPQPPRVWNTSTPISQFALPSATKWIGTATPIQRTSTLKPITRNIDLTSLPLCLGEGELFASTDNDNEKASTEGNGKSGNSLANILASLGFASIAAALAALNARLKRTGSNKTASLTANGIYIPMPHREEYRTTVGEWISRPIKTFVWVTKWVWETIKRQVANFIWVTRKIVDWVKKTEWVKTIKRVWKPVWQYITKRVPLLGWLGRVLGWIWKTVFEPVYQWVKKAIWTLKTWWQKAISYVRKRIQDGWRTITERIRKKVGEWIEKIDWVRDWVTKEITLKRTVWKSKFIPFGRGGGKLASPTRSRLLSLATLLGISLSVLALLNGSDNSDCGCKPCPPTATPDYFATATSMQATADACAWQNAYVSQTAMAATQTAQARTATPVPTATLTVYPTGEPYDPARDGETIWEVDNRRNEFLQAVLRHQGELPEGMNVQLILAMGSAEKGVCSDWSQVTDPCNPANADGILQMSPDAGDCRPEHPGYNDTHGGYERNVSNAVCALNKIDETWQRPAINDRFNNMSNSEAIKKLRHGSFWRI